MGAFIISPLPPVLKETLQTVGSLGSTDVTLLQSSYGPGRHPLVLGRFPGVAGYTTYLAPAISAWDEEGFSSFVTRPGHRAAACTPPEWVVASARVRRLILPSPIACRLGLWS